MQAGDLVLIDIYNMHRTASLSAPQYSRMLIIFSPEFIDGAGGGDGGPDLLLCFRSRIGVLPLEKRRQAYVLGLMKRMLRETEERQIGYEALVRQLLVELLIFIRRTAGDRPLQQAALQAGIHVKFLWPPAISTKTTCGRWRWGRSPRCAISATITFAARSGR